MFVCFGLVGSQTLAYVIDHSVEKGAGISVYVNANASHAKGKERRDPKNPTMQLYDIMFEVRAR